MKVLSILQYSYLFKFKDMLYSILNFSEFSEERITLGSTLTTQFQIGLVKSRASCLIGF